MQSPISQTVSQRLETLMERLGKDFSIEGLNKSPARFNLKKLQDINSRFIRMMSLEEFVLRCQQLKISHKDSKQNTRITDIVYIVDTEAQEVFAHKSNNPVFEDGLYHFIGGGREDNQNAVESLSREITEELGGKINIESNQILPLAEFQHLWGFPIKESDFDGKYVGFEGKEFSVFFYKVSKSDLESCIDPEHSDHNYEWHDLTEVLSSNSYLTLSIYNEFCIKYNIPAPLPNKAIITQYCAWLLDKNRVTTLSEFGKESDCVLNWQQPAIEDVKWRKSSVHDSISNLQEIGEFISGLFEHNPHRYPTHIDQVEHYMKESSLWWEESIKNWINSMEYSAGDYLWPLRVALSGQTKSPSPFEILAAISQDEAQKRLNLVIKSV